PHRLRLIARSQQDRLGNLSRRTYSQAFGRISYYHVVDHARGLRLQVDHTDRIDMPVRSSDVRHQRDLTVRCDVDVDRQQPGWHVVFFIGHLLAADLEDRDLVRQEFRCKGTLAIRCEDDVHDRVVHWHSIDDLDLVAVN